MILERVVLENFRPYEGRNELEFARPGDKNVTVVLGLNGTGKSTIFLALKWCFWGVTDLELRALACNSALRAAKEGEIVETRVEVAYEHEGRRFKAIRSFRSRVGASLEDGSPSFSAEPTAQFQLFELTPSGDAEPVTTYYEELTSAIPRAALDYFFFDSEEIGRFAVDSSGGAIREAVRQVLRFNELNAAAKHVDQARQEYAKKLRAVSGPGARDLVEQREARITEAERLREDIQRSGDETASARNIRDQHLARLQELASLSELMAKRAELVARKQGAIDARQEALDTLSGSLPNLALALAQPAFAAAKAVVNTKRRRGEIPSKVKSQVLRDWLEIGQCICGRELGPDSDERQRVIDELNKTLPSRAEDELVSIGASIDATTRASTNQLATARASLEKLNQSREAAMILADKLRELEAQLIDQPDEDVSKIGESIQRLDRQIQDRAIQRSRWENELAKLVGEIESLNTEIAKTEFRSREATRLEQLHTLAVRTVEALRALELGFERDVRAEIEREASRLFSQLVWKKEHYQSVTLSPDYRLEATNRWGEAAFSTGETSFGESRILSIAFIVAMQVVARDSVDARTPAVIDSPFSNLSAKPIQNVCERLPELVDQVVLFLTDVDWTSSQDVLTPRTGVLCELIFDSRTSTTTIEPVH